jgi:hypothetical protein
MNISMVRSMNQVFPLESAAEAFDLMCSVERYFQSRQDSVVSVAKVRKILIL